MRLRFGTLSDLASMRRLYADTVSQVCSADYSQDQIAVWIRTADDQNRWLGVIRLQKVIIAERNNKILGFGTLRDHNYIDFFYISGDHQRKGIASLILEQLELHARQSGTRTITCDVSITARGFFEKNGYVVIREQHNLRGDVDLVNFFMSKDI